MQDKLDINQNTPHLKLDHDLLFSDLMKVIRNIEKYNRPGLIEAFRCILDKHANATAVDIGFYAMHQHIIKESADFIDELKAKVAMLEAKLDDAKNPSCGLVSGAEPASYVEHPQLNATFHVIEYINKEISYQNNKCGMQHNRNQTVEGHLLILRKKLNDAENGWFNNLTGRNSVERELVQVAAVAIQALINLDNAGRLQC